MRATPDTPADRVRPLLRVRQFREFTDQALSAEQLAALVDAARWSGSAQNSQPWRFVAIRDIATVRRLGEAGMPQTRGLQTAAAAIAIVLPEQPGMAVSHAFDEGRAAERILVAATLLGLGAGISWTRPENRPAVHAVLGVPEGHVARTIVAVGYPTEEASRPRSAPGAARLPRGEVVFEESWPEGRA
jgi:nitroreductase